MTSPPPAEDQETCCYVCSALVTLLPSFCSEDALLATGRAKPPHHLCSRAPNGWGSVCRVTETTTKARHTLRDKVSLCIPPTESSSSCLCSVTSFTSTVNKVIAHRGMNALTQDSCSMGSTISYSDLRENLEKGVCQAWQPRHSPPVCQIRLKYQLCREICSWTTGTITAHKGKAV